MANLSARSLDTSCREGLRAAWLHNEVRVRLCAALREFSRAPRGEAESEHEPEAAPGSEAPAAPEARHPDASAHQRPGGEAGDER